MVPSCGICDRESKSWGSLVKHVSQTHCIDAEKYYLQFLGTRTNCQYCGSNETRFINSNLGYSNHCKVCSKLHSKETARKRREVLKNNPAAYEKFICRLSKSVSDTWHDRKETKFNASDEELEQTYKKLAKTMRLDVDFSKAITPQLDVIVNDNLSELFGLRNGSRN